MQLNNYNIKALKANKTFFLFTEARSSRLKKIILPLLLILKLKMAIILPIVLTLLTFISLKGLKAGLLALLFSGRNEISLV